MTSKTFCIEKWISSTIYLHTGTTHSCHHPGPHEIPLQEIKFNPRALHNTEYKKQQRQIMLDGSRPAECEYCWRSEDSNGTIRSDRQIANEKFQDQEYIKQLNAVDDVDPKHLEVGFSNGCNFKCAYCGPAASSKWTEEINQYGPYPTSDNFGQRITIPILEREENPYVEAFWKWFPDLYNDLETLRVTGGEPLLSKHTFTLLDYVIANPKSNLTLSINTNLGVDSAIIEKFLDRLSLIKQGIHVKKISIHTSNEASGARAEYIRYGLNYNEWLGNIKKLVDKGISVSLMSVPNLLGVTSFQDMLVDLHNIGGNTIKVGTSHLTYPKFLDIRLLPREWSFYLHDSLNYMTVKNSDSECISRFEQTINHFNLEIDNRKILLQDLKKFIVEYDRRRGTTFNSVFPEYVQWMSTIDQSPL
jgi:organic radical activating enzyme